MACTSVLTFPIHRSVVQSLSSTRFDSLSSQGGLAMYRIFIVALLLVGLAGPASGGMDEGFAAYERGDIVMALREWRPLAEHGEVDAQILLGFIYTNGQGVPQDYVQAYMWFNLAAASSSTGAITNRGIIAKKMTPAQIAKAEKLANEWAAKHGGS